MATKETDRDRSADVRSATDRKSLGNYYVKIESPDKAPMAVERSGIFILIILEEIMATPIVNTFQQFQLTEAEQLSGQQYSNMQLMVIQNLLADNAIKKLNLNYDASNPQQFMQQEAELSGWIGCLNYLIECHTAAQTTATEVINVDNPESGPDAYSTFNP